MLENLEAANEDRHIDRRDESREKPMTDHAMLFTECSVNNI